MRLIKLLSLSFLLIATTSCLNKNSRKSNQQQTQKTDTMEINKEPTLQSMLDAQKNKFAAKADEETKRIYKEGQESIENSGILESKHPKKYRFSE